MKKSRGYRMLKLPLPSFLIPRNPPSPGFIQLFHQLLSYVSEIWGPEDDEFCVYSKTVFSKKAKQTQPWFGIYFCWGNDCALKHACKVLFPF